LFRKYDVPFELDDPRATVAHRDIIVGKPFLKRLYTEWYAALLDACRDQLATGHCLEVGSGGGFLAAQEPRVITSDILQLPGVDVVCDAQGLPFSDGSLSAIVMLNAFHHIPSPARFLSEAERTLAVGGKIVMIEPANSWFGRLIYKRFHHEPFDEHAGLEIRAGSPLSNSNQALPYIFFEREKAWFEEQFPRLRVRRIDYHSPLRYIASGGLSMPALLPTWLYPAVSLAERVLKPFSRRLGLFCTLEVERL
jgi:SAM-dependent methyltransferase